jgi:hypothetical protein
MKARALVAWNLRRIRVKRGSEELAEVLEVPPSGTVQYQVRFPD